MNKKIYLALFTLFLSAVLFAQDNSELSAQALFNDGKYSAAQAIINKNNSSHSSSAELMYLNAKCSKELFLSDAVLLYDMLNEHFPYHEYKEDVNVDLALIYYREKKYVESITHFLSLSELSNEHLFKLAYANFSIDSLEIAQLYFSKLRNVESKFSSTAQYYYSYIAYERLLYKSALEGFKKLLDDEKFGAIVPYYISQIYFHQKQYTNLISFAKPLLANVIASRKSEINRLLAESYYRIADYNNATIHFEQFLSAEPNHKSIDYFLLGHSYFKSSDFDNAVANLEKVSNSEDSVMQYSTYYLGASYLELENYNYALQAFKKSSTYNYNTNLKEDATFNYAKLSYQLELPFENTLQTLKDYLETYNHPLNKKEIEQLMVQTLQGTSKYLEAYNALKDIHLPTINQKKSLQQLAFFLGVQSYNKQDYKDAIAFFTHANNFPENSDFSYLSNYWVADCYYQINDFEKAIKIYTDLSVSSNANLSDYGSLKKYNLAYAYFKTENYSSAVKWFRSYEKISVDSMRLNDSYLRIADCYFMQSEFALAEKYYKNAIEYNLFDTDYAIFNRSTSLGLIGKNSLKVKLLKQLVADYSKSSYYDDALYGLAKYYKNTAKYDLANKYYDDVILASSNQDFKADSYLSKGMIAFNRGQVEVAIEGFLFVVNNYQHSKYFKEALSGLQAAYSSIAKVDEYLAVIESLPEVSISKAEQDSLTYNTAFMKFSELEYEVAKGAFTKYIERFVNGIFINDAIYYNAICGEKTADTLTALKNYEKVVFRGVAIYQERALLYLARSFYNKDNYEKSNVYYFSLVEFASSNSIKREVIIRLMTGFENVDNVIAFEYANQVIELDKKDDWLLSKAYIIIARNEFENGNYAKSKSTFEKVIKLSAYDEGAEAKYYLAYLTYLDEDLVLAEQMIFELAEVYSSDHFIAKAFILLSDIYVEQENNFQAKATLESIIENHDGEDLVNIAREKWEVILAQEKEIVVEVIEEQSFIEISEDEFEYEVKEFDEDYEVPMPDTTNISMDSLEIINENILEDEIE